MNEWLSERFRELLAQAVRDIAPGGQSGAGLISFAGHLPADDLFPSAEVREAALRLYKAGKKKGGLQPGRIDGGSNALIRQWLCERLQRQGVQLEQEQLLVTASPEQTVELVLRTLASPGDAVLVENPTSAALLELLRSHNKIAVPVPTDNDGMVMDELELLISRGKPGMICCAPDFGDPNGRVWSLQRRLELLELCGRYGIIIVEDACRGELGFEESSGSPSLLSLQGKADNGCVLHTGSFINTLGPSLPISWAAGDRQIIGSLARAKSAAGDAAGSFGQALLGELLPHFSYESHIRQACNVYRSRMRRMTELLGEQGGGELSWITPKGGLHLWLKLPGGLDAAALLRCSLLKGVEFAPGASFFAAEPERAAARLNFACVNDERMEIGIAGLADAVKEFTARR